MSLLSGAQLNSRISGTGSAFPKRAVTNAELCEWISGFEGEVPEGFGPDWIRDRTGIDTRHFVSEDETLSDLSLTAATRALEAANLSAIDLDGILLATCTPEKPLPSSASFLQLKLGASRAFAMDLNAACSGFQHAWAAGHAMITAGMAKHLLIVGADVLSSITDYTDRKSGILFGDGAGAIVLSLEDLSLRPNRFLMSANGQEWDLFEVPAGGSAHPFFGMNPRDRHAISYPETRMQMRGAEIFKTSVRTMVELSKQAIAAEKVPLTDIDWIIPHQANLRILEAVSRKLGVGMERFIVNIKTRGNTSAATVPTALDEGIRSGKIQRGDRLLIPVFGAGTTAGAAVTQY